VSLITARWQKIGKTNASSLEGVSTMSSFQNSAALALAIGLAGTPAEAALPSGSAIQAVVPAPDGGNRAFSIVRAHDARLRVAIQWSGSNGGDDTPFEDHPF
jgi:hypothetical protein